MTAPTKSDLRSLGYRMSANADDLVVGRCASAVLEAYILKHVTQAEVSAASLTDEIGGAWAALTFLRFLQDTDFGTRTGGEKKRFEYGDPAEVTGPVKAECALRLKKLGVLHPATAKVDDICKVYFKNQLFH